MALTYREEVLADNPIAFWPLDESVGASEAANLVSGGPSLAHTADVVTGETTAFAPLGRSAYYNGVAGVNSFAGVVTSTSNNVTVEAWAEVPASGRGAFVLVGNSSNNGFAIGMGGTNFDNTGSRFLVLYEGIRWLNSNFTLTAGWHHFALVIESTHRLYVDGVQRYSDTSTYPRVPTIGTKVGGYVAQSTYARHFTGRIDEVAVYDTALSAERIAAHYAAREVLATVEPLKVWDGAAWVGLPKVWDGSGWVGTAKTWTGTEWKGS